MPAVNFASVAVPSFADADGCDMVANAGIYIRFPSLDNALVQKEALLVRYFIRGVVLGGETVSMMVNFESCWHVAME